MGYYQDAIGGKRRAQKFSSQMHYEGSINVHVYEGAAHLRGSYVPDVSRVCTLEYCVYYGLNNIVYDNGFAKLCIWNIALSVSNTRISHAVISLKKREISLIAGI